MSEGGMDKQRQQKRRRRKSGDDKKANRTERNLQEIRELEERSQAEAPAPGSMVRKDGKSSKLFADLPLSQYTLSGLERGSFTRLTRIQQLAIPHALAGRDVLGAARTGSGKTLAFLVPLFEKLYRAGWQTGLGVGALVISPTRELALQIYEVVRVVGYRHMLSAGLVMGGSNFQTEQQHVHQIAVMICTPGRLLQHLEQTPTMDTDSLQVLVLDEADRLLDLGFKEQLTQILDYLPKDRQTMLFSATQTKSVKALARLSLRQPEYVSVLRAGEAGADAGKNDRGAAPTPANLVQAYSVCQLPEKMDLLYSFIRSHLKSKVIVFLSSCKQVKYVDAVFRKLRPGVPLMSIHGKMKQQKRMHIYYDYIKKPAAVMFATDIAARGLDFPAVDWVVQVDCPEDVPSYIHRVGRTARYKNRGRALLLLLPNEATGMLPLLQEARIPITERKINPAKQQSILPKLQAEVAKDPELKLNAQRAFKSYIRSVHLQPEKRVFNVKKLPMGAFAQSLGLANTPRIKISGAGGESSRAEHRNVKNMPHGLAKLNELMGDADGGDGGENDNKDDDDVLALVEKVKSSRRGKKTDEADGTKKKGKWERLLALKASDPVAQSQLAKAANNNSDDSDDDSSDDGLVLRGRQAAFGEGEGDDLDAADRDRELLLDQRASKKQVKHLRIGKDGAARGRLKPKRREFDDEGNEVSPFAKLAEELGDHEGGDETVTVARPEDRAAHLDKIAARLRAEDDADRERERERVKAMHKEKRLKLRGADTTADTGVAMLGGSSDNEDEDEDEDEDEGSSDGDASSGSSDSGSAHSKGRKRGSEGGAPTSKRSKLDTEEDVEAAALRLIQAQGLA